MKRIFIALDISDDAKKEIARISSLIRPINAKTSWVRPENMHITVSFLGNTEEEKIECLKEKINSIKFSPFQLILDKISAFPNISQPKVLWIGQDKPNTIINQIYQSTVSIIQECNAQFDKKEQFIPHITLARIKTKPSHRDIEKISKIASSLSPITCTIQSLTIYQSQLTQNGPVYTKIN